MIQERQCEQTGNPIVRRIIALGLLDLQTPVLDPA